MKNYIFLSCIICLLLSNTGSSQYVSISDIGYGNDNPRFHQIKSREEWPRCSDPKNIRVSIGSVQHEISWDEHLTDFSDIEYEVYLPGPENSNRRTSDIISQNKLFLSNQNYRDFNWEKFKVRKICKSSSNGYFFSDWVSIDFSSACMAEIDNNAITSTQVNCGSLQDNTCYQVSFGLTGYTGPVNFFLDTNQTIPLATIDCNYQCGINEIISIPNDGQLHQIHIRGNTNVQPYCFPDTTIFVQTNPFKSCGLNIEVSSLPICNETNFDIQVNVDGLNGTLGDSIRMFLRTSGAYQATSFYEDGQYSTATITNVPLTLGNYVLVFIFPQGTCSLNPVSVNLPEVVCPDGCAININEVQCGSSTYSVQGSIYIETVNAGETITITDYPSLTNQHIVLQSNIHNYSFNLQGIDPDGLQHELLLDCSSCPNGQLSTVYMSPNNCITYQDCVFSVDSIAVSRCNPVDDSYVLSFYMISDCPLDQTVEISVTGMWAPLFIHYSDTIGIYTVELPNLIADGEPKNLKIKSTFGGTQNFSFTSPSPCGNELNLTCGGNRIIDSLSSQIPLPILKPNDFFIVHGIPIIVKNASGSNGVFSGSGVMSVPFSSTRLAVTFNQISINSDYQVIAGEVSSVASTINLSTLPNPPSLSIGGDICINKPESDEYDEDGFNRVTGLNARGFKRDSLFYPDSTRYDRNGYDFNGIHRETGTKYDEFGCDMNSLDSYGNPCVRDSALIARVDSLISTIFPEKYNDLLDSLHAKLLDTLNSFSCDSLRNVMQDKIYELGYNPVFIKGPNGEYFNPGLEAHFLEAPRPMLLNSSRDTLVISLERIHCELYRCDVLSKKIAEHVQSIRGISQEEFQQFLKSELLALDHQTLETFKNNPANLSNWIIQKITEFLHRNKESAGYGFSSKHNSYHEYAFANQKKLNLQKNQSAFAGHIASLEDFSISSPFNITKEAEWLFMQGEQNILGIEREYFIEDAYRSAVIQSDENLGVLTPLLIKKDSAGVIYNIYLDNISVSPAGGKLDAYFIMELPNSTEKKLILKRLNIDWGPNGLVGESALGLGSEIEIKLSNAALLRLKPQNSNGPGTYISWDCNGFRSISLDAEVELCRNMVIPLGNDLQALPEPARFSFEVKTILRHWSDFYFELSAPKFFAIAGMENFKWSVSRISLDMSDYLSPQAINVFSSYESPFFTGSSFTPAWRGFFLENLTCVLPQGLKDGNNQAISISLNNLIFDDTGFTGSVSATNLLSIENGNAGGWPIGIDSINITIIQNSLFGGGLKGAIRVPTFSDNIQYLASIRGNGDFSFLLSMPETLNMNMTLAKVSLLPESTVGIKILDGQVEALATLSGSMSISSIGNPDIANISIPKIQFTNFQVSNQAPYFSPGFWTIDSSLDASLGGFKISLDSIRPVSSSVDSAGLAFFIGVKLPLSFTAYGEFEIFGSLHVDANGRQRWDHARTSLSGLYIDCSFQAGHVKGGLFFFRSNPKYGSGFQGLVDMNFQGIGSLKAVAQFGKVNSEDYFFIDASVSTSGLMIPVGPLKIDGFNGGVAYKMRMEGIGANQIFNQSVRPPIGSSFSGTNYSPDPSIGLSLKAGVYLKHIANEKIFNGNAFYSMSFHNNNGPNSGVASIAFNGTGQMMANIPIPGFEVGDESVKPSNIDASIAVHIRFDYHRNTPSGSYFAGKLIAFLNAGVLKGSGPNGKLVDGQIYIDNSKWYFYLGTPQSPCGIELDLPFVPVEATVKGYFCVGTVIPALPEVPRSILAIAGDLRPNPSFLKTGRGILFGSELKVKASINLWVASGSFGAVVGYDLMVRDFGNSTCVETGKQVGIDGWYAVGQIYAMIEGKLEVVGFTIFKAGIAAVLRAQLPNPFFAQANIGVRIKTFLGSVQKNMNIKLGNNCTINSEDDGSPMGMAVISHITPSESAEDVEVNETPNISFNLPLNTKFEIGPDKYEARRKRIRLFSLKTQIPYDFVENIEGDGSFMDLVLPNMFNSNDSIQIAAEVEILKNGQIIGTEIKFVNFTTGSRMDYIPEANVEASYPANGMKSFFPNENNRNTGFIKLKQGMPEIFYNIPSDEALYMRLTKKGGEAKYFDYNSYDGMNATLDFPLDPSWLSPNTDYTIELVRMKKTGDLEIPGRGVSLENQLANLSLPSLAQPDLTSGSKQTNQKVHILWSAEFKTSQFKTFAEFVDSGSAIIDDKVFRYSIPNSQLSQFEINKFINWEVLNLGNWKTDPVFECWLFYPSTINNCSCPEYCGSSEYNLDVILSTLSAVNIENSNNQLWVNNMIYLRTYQMWEIKKYSLIGCQGSNNIGWQTDIDFDSWTYINSPPTSPFGIIKTVLEYTIPGLGTTSSINLE